MPVSPGGLDKGQVVNGFAVSGDANDSEVGIVPVGGQDGANRREFLVDTAGRPIQLLSDGTTTLPIALDGVAVKTAGIQILGDDGVNSVNVSVDSAGRVNTNTVVNPSEEVTTPVPVVAVAVVTGSFTSVASFTPGADTATTKLMMSSTDATIWQVKYGTTSSEAVIAYFQTSGSNLNLVIPLRLAIATTQTIIVEAKGTKSSIDAFATIVYE